MNLELPSKVLITGAAGFTGKALVNFLMQNGFNVSTLKSNILDASGMREEIRTIAPDYVVHLAAISFTEERDISSFYNVNIQGTINLLEELKGLPDIKKVILLSSAAVYGNQNSEVLDEGMSPKPVNHYGCSKFSMECMSEKFKEFFPILIARPFNYTGIGQADHFLVPKIVKAYKSRFESIELGNLDVYREFNDVRDICKIYVNLLFNKSATGILNICTGKSVSVRQIIEKMNRITGYELNVNVNPLYVRSNEIYKLVGSTDLLRKYINLDETYSIDDTLKNMYESACQKI